MAINDRRYRAGLMPDACCLLPVASSERGTVAINDRRYRAGLMPDAYCLFPFPCIIPRNPEIRNTRYCKTARIVI